MKNKGSFILISALALCVGASAQTVPPAKAAVPSTELVSLTLDQAARLSDALKTLSGSPTKAFPNPPGTLNVSGPTRVALFRDVLALKKAFDDAVPATNSAIQAALKADGVVFTGQPDPKTGGQQFDLTKMTLAQGKQFNADFAAANAVPFTVALQKVSVDDLGMADGNAIPPSLAPDLQPILK